MQIEVTRHIGWACSLQAKGGLHHWEMVAPKGETGQTAKFLDATK
jgi:hypothetical protein